MVRLAASYFSFSAMRALFMMILPEDGLSAAQPNNLAGPVWFPSFEEVPL
jgi:hypothetical protein